MEPITIFLAAIFMAAVGSAIDAPPPAAEAREGALIVISEPGNTIRRPRSSSAVMATIVAMPSNFDSTID